MDVLRLTVRLCLLAAIGAAAAQLGYLVFDLAHKSYGDGPILAMAEKMREAPISADWMREPPYVLSCYGPAYYWLTNALAEVGGWRHSLIPGRLLALAAALATSTLAGLTAWRRTRNGEISLLAALVFLVSLPVSEWVPHARVDMLGLALVAGAYLAVGPGRGGLAVSALLIAAGSLAKPTMALSAVPIAAHLLATRRRGDAAFFSGLVAALGAAAWGAVQWASDGFFLTAVLLGNRNPMQLWRGYFFTYQFLFCPLAIAALLVAARMLIESPARFAQSLFSLGFILSLCMSAVTVCKQGSELNYFLEPALLGSLAIAVEGAVWLSSLNARRALVAMGLLGAALALPNLRELRQNLRSPATRSPAYETARHWLAGEPPGVGLLADGRMVDVVLATGHRPWLNDSYLYMLLVGNGTLDPAPLIERLRDGRIKWLFLRKTLDDHRDAIDRGTDCWPREVIGMFPRYYELVDKSDGLFIYRHRDYGGGLDAGRRLSDRGDVGHGELRVGQHGA